MTVDDRSIEEAGQRSDRSHFARRVWIAVTIVTVVFLALFVLWNATDIILVLFAGALLAVFLHGISEWVHARTGVSNRISLLVTVLAIVLLLGAAGWLAAPSIADQAARLGPQLTDAIEQLEARLGVLPLPQGQQQDGEGGAMQQLFGMGTNLVSQVTGVFSTTIGFVTNLVVVLFVGLYFAYEPQLYIDGFLTLLPKERRVRGRDVIDEVHYSLRWWLVGRLANMLIIGALVTIGLLLLGVPLALLLGALAGLLDFIPYFGPLISLVPALLIAFANSPTQALYVLALYLGVQFVESYVVTPIIEKRVVSLAPVMLIGSQLLLGVVFGFWGLLLAPALMVAGKVVVKKLYVEDVLGDHSVTYITDERDDG